MSIGRVSLLRSFLPRPIRPFLWSAGRPSGTRPVSPFGSGPRAVLGRLSGRTPAAATTRQPYNPFGGYWGDRRGAFGAIARGSSAISAAEGTGEGAGTRAAPDYSHAPPATPRKDATVKIVVMGDENADWLAYGL